MLSVKLQSYNAAKLTKINKQRISGGGGNNSV